MSEIIIDDGETRTDLTLENDDTMLVKFGGLASQTTVKYQAVMTVAGGTARVMTVSSGGEMSATSGGIVSNTTVKAGSMYLDGNASASSTVLSGMDFQSGGKIVAVQAVMNIINAAVFSTTVSSGGNMTVSAYGGTATATNTTVNAGGNMTVAYGSATDTTVSSGGKLTAVNATVGCGK